MFGSDFVAAAGDAATLKQFVAGLNSGGGGFAGTPFGQRVAAQYKNGAEILFGANLESMTPTHRPYAGSENTDRNLELTGLADVEYLIAERKGSGAQIAEPRATYLCKPASWTGLLAGGACANWRPGLRLQRCRRGGGIHLQESG